MEGHENDFRNESDTSKEEARLVQRLYPDGIQRWRWIVISSEDEFDEDDEFSPVCCPFCGLGDRDFCCHQVGQWDDGIEASGMSEGTYPMTDPYFRLKAALGLDKWELDEDERDLLWTRLDQSSLNSSTKALIETMLQGDEQEDSYYLDFLQDFGVEDGSRAWEGGCISGTRKTYFHPDPLILLHRLGSIEAEALAWISRERESIARSETDEDSA